MQDESCYSQCASMLLTTISPDCRQYGRLNPFLVAQYIEVSRTMLSGLYQYRIRNRLRAVRSWPSDYLYRDVHVRYHSFWIAHAAGESRSKLSMRGNIIAKLRRFFDRFSCTSCGDEEQWTSFRAQSHSLWRAKTALLLLWNMLEDETENSSGRKAVQSFSLRLRLRLRNLA